MCEKVTVEIQIHEHSSIVSLWDFFACFFVHCVNIVGLIVRKDIELLSSMSGSIWTHSFMAAVKTGMNLTHLYFFSFSLRLYNCSIGEEGCAALIQL